MTLPSGASTGATQYAELALGPGSRWGLFVCGDDATLSAVQRRPLSLTLSVPADIFRPSTLRGMAHWGLPRSDASNFGGISGRPKVRGVARDDKPLTGR
jgi:hypothetical protein